MKKKKFIRKRWITKNEERKERWGGEEYLRI